MNYIALLNQFWQLRREVPFSSVEADLYFYLLEISNGLQWKNPFQQSNALIGATLGVSEKTLIAARNRLKQYGLIDFHPGVKRLPSSYKLLLLAKPTTGNTLSHTLENFQPIREECASESDSKSGSESGSVSGKNAPDINKRKHKPNKRGDAASASASVGEGEVRAEEREFAWVVQNAPRILQMKEPLTAAQYVSCCAAYSKATVQDVCLGMQNETKLLTKYLSANLTIRNWCKRRGETTPHRATPNRTSATLADKVAKQRNEVPL